MDNSFVSVIDSSRSILILLPTKPYLDQVAAALSLYLSLKDKKNITVSCPTEMIVEFNRLVGVDRIGSELGNKNLTLKFAGYNASDIEKVSYDIENGEFKLTIVPKPGFSSPTKEQVNYSYSGISCDTVILIGGGNPSHFPVLSEDSLSGAKIIHLGIKEIFQEKVMSLVKPASSVSEIVAGLIEQSGYFIDSDIATNLLVGIENGSKGFTVAEVTAETFQIVSNLMKLGGTRMVKEKFIKDDFTRGFSSGRVVQRDIPKISEDVTQDNKQTPSGKPPKDWLEPKIYKGTTVS